MRLPWPENLIHLLNPKIRGWANYFRFSCAKRTFSYVDHCIHMALWSWVRRRHTRKRALWIKRKYFRSQGLRDWIFFARTLKESGEIAYVDLFNASSVAIKRHAKIRAEATPFDPCFTKYFEERERNPRKNGAKLQH